MILKPYIDYFKYVVEHKKNVFIECWNMKLYKQAFTHDLSKFLPSEFIPYAKYFYINKEKYEKEFNDAWEHHLLNNKHHWDFWCFDVDEYYNNMCTLQQCELKQPNEMDEKYIKEMICDWNAMSRKFGGTTQNWYLNNYNDIILHPNTRYRVEYLLGLLSHYNAPICESTEEYWETLQQTAIRYKQIQDERGIDKWNAKDEFNDLHKWICDNYNIDDLYSKIIG